MISATYDFQPENATDRMSARLAWMRESDKGKISVLVVSPAAESRKMLRTLLSDFLPQDNEILEVASCERALELARIARPDILIIDARTVKQPKLDCISRLGYRVAIILIVDALDEAQRAFDLGAIDCILAPVKADRLERALQRARTWTVDKRGDINEIAAWSDDSIESKTYARWLRVVRGRDLLVVRPEEVIYFQADRKVTRVVLCSTEGFIRVGINNVSTKLDPSIFWRIHRGVIVNAGYVDTVRQDDLGRAVLQLRGRGEKLFASRVHERKLLQDGIS